MPLSPDEIRKRLKVLNYQPAWLCSRPADATFEPAGAEEAAGSPKAASGPHLWEQGATFPANPVDPQMAIAPDVAAVPDPVARSVEGLDVSGQGVAGVSDLVVGALEGVFGVILGGVLGGSAISEIDAPSNGHRGVGVIEGLCAGCVSEEPAAGSIESAGGDVPGRGSSSAEGSLCRGGSPGVVGWAGGNARGLDNQGGEESTEASAMNEDLHAEPVVQKVPNQAVGDEDVI